MASPHASSRIAAAGLVLLAGWAGSAQAQAEGAAGAGQPSVDEIIARHVEAKGGEEALAALRSYKATGTYMAFSIPEPFTLWRAWPDSVRFETVLLGDPFLESYDGDAGWSRAPIAGTDWPLTMSAPEVTAMVAIADFDGPLIGYRDKGHEVTLAGRVDFDGIDAWQLDVERAEGFEETWFLDAETYLEAGRLAPTHDFGSPVPGKSYFDDFRPVAGVQIPHVVEQEYLIRHRRMEIEEIVVNPEIPDGHFGLPPLAEMEALAAMAGEWHVTVEARPPFEQAPWRESGTTSSTVRPEMDGALLVEEIELDHQGRTVHAFRTLSWDRFAERYRLTHFDDYTSHTNVFEGTLEDGRLTLTNADTGTGPVIGGETQTGRWTISEIGEDGFVVEQEAPAARGEEWVGVLRWRYRAGGLTPDGGSVP